MGFSQNALIRSFVSFRLGLFYIGIFMVIGILMPFWPVWLKSRGLTLEEIGIIMAAGLWVKLIANPVFAKLADNWGKKRDILVGLSLAAGIAFFIYGMLSGFWWLFFFNLIAISLFAPLMPLGENLTMLVSYAKKLDYGRIRLWGSLSFILSAYLGGLILSERSEALIPMLVVGACFITFLFSLGLPEPPPLESPAPASPLRHLLRSPVFIIFLIAASLTQAAHGTYYGFATLHWRSLGYSDGTIGLLWAVGVLAEVVLFAISGKVIARVGPARLLLLAGVAGVARWPLTGMASSLIFLVPLQCLHALTFGATHLAAMHFITRASPHGCSATAQGLYSSLAMGAALGLSMLLSGFLFAASPAAAFAAMGVIALVGGLFAFLLNKTWNGGTLEGNLPA